MASPFPNGSCKVRHIGKSGIDSLLSTGVCYTLATKIVQTPLVTEDTAHIQMKGPEFLRGIYSASGLGIRARPNFQRLRWPKQVLAAVAGVRPEEIIIREAQAHPHRSYASPDAHVEILTNAIREAVRKD